MNRSDRRRRSSRLILGLVLGLGLLASLTGPAAAAEPPDRPAGDRVVDRAGVLTGSTQQSIEEIIAVIDDSLGAEVVVATEAVATVPAAAAARSRAAEYLVAWSVGENRVGGGLVILVQAAKAGCPAILAMAGDERFERRVPAADRTRIVADDVGPVIATCSIDTAVIIALGQTIAVAANSVGGVPPIGSSGGGRPGRGGPANAPPPGPPFPALVPGQVVYDYAGVFRPETIASAQTTIEAIEKRTRAEVYVYTQVVGYGVDEAEAERAARALMDQWGIGRKGFDDGLVIFFDLDPSLKHGQVQLYAGPGYRATFLSNEERQAIFENDMRPFLVEGNLDDALLIAMRRVDENATPEHAQALERGRQLNAVIGLVGSPLMFILLVGWAGWNWLRFGRDPVYLDDPSILMPAPPAELTAATGALIVDGRSTRRTLTTAMLDLASRGEIAFREEKTGLFGLGAKKVGIEVGEAAARTTDTQDAFQLAKARRRPISAAEQLALRRLTSLAIGGYLEPGRILEFGPTVAKFDEHLEAHAVARGWLGEPPKKAVQRWRVRAIAVMVIGGIAIFGAFNLPASGLLLLGGAMIAAGVIILGIATAMPARTMSGAMIQAMLAAYRRTLQQTMKQARSVQQVIDESGLSWLETPDQAVVWSVALGLGSEIEEVIGRTVEDVKKGLTTESAYVPTWYHGGDGSGGLFGGGGGGGGGGSAFSSSVVPDFGGMMSALGTIGDSPSSSGSGGSGGGSSGGGGGGAGGGF